MSSTVSNLINILFFRLRKLERSIKNINNNYFISENTSKPLSIQLFDEKSVQLIQPDNNQFIYMNDGDTNLFTTNIETDNHNILNIQTSASFITDVENIQEGSVVLKLKINNTLICENETYLLNDGFTNVSLNYNQQIEQDSLYKIEVNFECMIKSFSEEIVLPIVSVRNNGGSLSILVI